MRRQSFNRGRWQTHRERCHIGDEVPGAAKNDSEPVGALIPAVMKSLGCEEPLWLRAVEEEWVGLVGKPVAKHARPGRYKDGTLVVFVDSAVWLSELKRYGQPDLLAKLQAKFGAGKIEKVSLQPDPDAGSPPGCSLRQDYGEPGRPPRLQDQLHRSD